MSLDFTQPRKPKLKATKSDHISKFQTPVFIKSLILICISIIFKKKICISTLTIFKCIVILFFELMFHLFRSENNLFYNKCDFVFSRAYLLNNQKNKRNQIFRESRERQEEKIGEMECFQLVNELWFLLCIVNAISLFPNG